MLDDRSGKSASRGAALRPGETTYSRDLGGGSVLVRTVSERLWRWLLGALGLVVIDHHAGRWNRG